MQSGGEEILDGMGERGLIFFVFLFPVTNTCLLQSSLHIPLYWVERFTVFFLVNNIRIPEGFVILLLILWD